MASSGPSWLWLSMGPSAIVQLSGCRSVTEASTSLSTGSYSCLARCLACLATLAGELETCTICRGSERSHALRTCHSSPLLAVQLLIFLDVRPFTRFHCVSDSTSNFPPHALRLHLLIVSVRIFTILKHCRMVVFSLVASVGAATSYLLDMHGADAQHILSLTRPIDILLFYGATFFVNGVFVARGFTTSLLVLGACQAVCFLPSVPMYVYGKRVRSFVSASCSLSAFTRGDCD